MTVSVALKKRTDAVRVRHFARGTEKAYGMWLKSYMEAGRKYPAGLSWEKRWRDFGPKRRGEVWRGVAAGTQNQALNAQALFYGAVLGTRLRAVDALRVTTVRVSLSPGQTASGGRCSDLGGLPAVGDFTRLPRWLLAVRRDEGRRWKRRSGRRARWRDRPSSAEP